MEDYRHATDKPDRTLINYNTVRAAELKAIYQSMVSDTTDQSLVNRFARTSEENVKECIDFLQAIDLIERGGDDRILTRINTDIYPDLSFEARILYHLRQQEAPHDHLTRIQGTALNVADRSITLEYLLPEVKNVLGADYDFSWNETKLRMWRSLATQLGLISETKSRGLILSPSRALVHDLFIQHQEHEGSDDLYDVLSWIETNFFDVFDSHTGTPTVHPAMSDVLQNMEADGVLTLRGMADAKNEVRIPESSHNPKPRSIKEYHIDEDQPESVAYQYPLAQFEVEAI